MAAVDQNSLRKLVEGQLLRVEGNAFQDCMDRLGLELYPGDYQPVRAAGPRGDTKGLILYAGTKLNHTFAGGWARLLGDAAVFKIARIDPTPPTSG
jgi:hypothetical protein